MASKEAREAAIAKAVRIVNSGCQWARRADASSKKAMSPEHLTSLPARYSDEDEALRYDGSVAPDIERRAIQLWNAHPGSFGDWSVEWAHVKQQYRRKALAEALTAAFNETETP